MYKRQSSNFPTNKVDSAEHGSSLTELLIVIGIVGVLLSMSLISGRHILGLLQLRSDTLRVRVALQNTQRLSRIGLGACSLSFGRFDLIGPSCRGMKQASVHKHRLLASTLPRVAFGTSGQRSRMFQADPLLFNSPGTITIQHPWAGECVLSIGLRGAIRESC